MTTKILTVRIPGIVYSALCSHAAQLGIPVAAHVRRMVEVEHQVNQIENLRTEILSRLDNLPRSAPTAPANLEELLMLARAIAGHLNPQLCGQIRARLSQQRQ